MVVKTVQINPNGSPSHWISDLLSYLSSNDLLNQFLDRYRAWKDHDSVYNHSSELVDIQKSHSGIPCFYYKDIENINQCNDPVVIIDCITEGKHSRRYFNRYKTNKHYIILSNESHCDKIDLDLKISYTWITYYYFLFLAAKYYLSPESFGFYIETEYQFYITKPMRFVSTNGSVRNERSHLRNQIINRIQYKNFIFKYSGVDYGMLSDQSDVVKFTSDQFDPYTSISKQHHNTGQTLPMDMYNQADFNLVVETDVDYQYGFLLSEKTIKCLITGMPFVIVATPYFLKYLAQLGFYTYGELWDESYDDELDCIKRIDKIVDLCNNLDKFDWAANQSALERIGLKNRSNFLNLNRVMTCGFREFEQSILELVV
jgi:hypothetical protein